MSQRGLIMLVGPENHAHMKGIARAVNKKLIKFPTHDWVYACHDLETTRTLLKLLGPTQYDVVVEPGFDRALVSGIVRDIHPSANTIIAVRGSEEGDYGRHMVIHLDPKEIQTPDGFQCTILSPLTRARDSRASRFY